MVVDDSAVIRGALTRICESDPGISVVATAVNGYAALSSLKRIPVDVVILDIEMPVMDGLTALPEILKISPKTKVLMASTLTLRNAEISLKALSLGASDYIPKPSTAQEVQNLDSFRRELVTKVRILAGRPLPRVEREPSSVMPVRQDVKTSQTSLKLRPLPIRLPAAFVIGSSTGGPQALMEVMRGLKDILKPIFITQHMPPKFTTALAKHLTTIVGRTVDEASHGQIVETNGIYLAPGDFHMRVERTSSGHKLLLDQGPKENFCRPSVDPLFKSASDAYAGQVMAVMLTGMGSDGLNGSRYLIDRGGALIAQDEATSVVWGMPGAVSEAGLASAILPLNKIAETMCAFAGKKG
jgi:two-component system chemotaxis response regulator CheB